MRESMAQLWRNMLAFGFRLLYNELACLYDPISWIASAGHWHEWQKTVRPHLPQQGRILEVGCGSGQLLADLLISGRESVGLDLSRTMLRLAQQRLTRQGLAFSLCRGQATTLPFAGEIFQAIVCTFPTAYVYDPTWANEAARVLRDGGRLLIVEMASFSGRALLPRSLEWLYHATGQREPVPELADLLEGGNLTARTETVEVNGTSVQLVLAEKTKGQ